jgi:hypothetical protein
LGDKLGKYFTRKEENIFIFAADTIYRPQIG